MDVLPHADTPFVARDQRHWAVPLQVAFPPDVGVSNQENPEEDDHLDEGKPPKRLEDQGPREQHDHFDIEDQENQRNDIEADVEADASVADRRLSALIGGEFARIRTVWPQEPCDDKSGCHEDHPHDEKQGDTTELGQHSGNSPLTGGESYCGSAARTRADDKRNVKEYTNSFRHCQETEQGSALLPCH